MCYDLRDPNYTIPTETDKRVTEPTSLNPFVVLKADRGHGPSLVQQIRELASLPAFHQGRFDQFCEDCQVTEEKHKKSLRELLRVLKKSDLELVDPDADKPWPVNRVH